MRRPFRVPWCSECAWETFDSQAAGCTRCGQVHRCSRVRSEACRAFRRDDGCRVCTITGCFIEEVPCADTEHVDTAAPAVGSGGCRGVLSSDLYDDVHGVVSLLLCSQRARRAVEEENAKQRAKLRAEFYKALKAFKGANPGRPPVIHQVLAQVRFFRVQRAWIWLPLARAGLRRICDERAWILLTLACAGLSRSCDERARCLTRV